MAGRIKIRGLRNVTSLDFDLPERGVWLLTASNGGGKTSLLACIRRIGHSNAFQLHFPASLQSDRLDNHLEGSITYEVDGEEVEYAYRGERWTPRPRANSVVLDEFGYPEVTYIGATADRITPRPDDFDPSRVRAVPQEIIRAANEIFETDKFNNLRKINLARGTGNDAFVMSLGGTPQKYHSERHFSLGELCILKLLKLLRDVRSRSLILIDELEMALHPRAQVRLLRYLEQQARNKRLCVIFSTHSVTLLKSIDRRRIIYLENDGAGNIEPVVGCFPTYAIGNISSDEEVVPDAIYYVEDDFGRDAARAFFARYADEEFEDPNARPTVRFSPIGGFVQTVKFLGESRASLPDHCRQHALLDADVSEETLQQWRRNDNHRMLADFQDLQGHIHFLPWTPENGIVEHALADINEFERALRRKFNDNLIRIRDTIQQFDDAAQGPQRRASAKSACSALIDYISDRVNRPRERVQEEVAETFALSAWDENRAEFLALFGRTLN